MNDKIIVKYILKLKYKGLDLMEISEKVQSKYDRFLGCRIIHSIIKNNNLMYDLGLQKYVIIEVN